MALWLKENAADSDIVVSTRARLARNHAGIPFPHKIQGTTQARMVRQAATDAFMGRGKDFKLLEMQTLSEVQKRRLIEQHIASKELCTSQDGALILSPDESISIMVMEEDHYRLQYLKSGFAPEEAYQVCREMEHMLGQKAEYAFNNKLGYLTACPTNVGTGLRIGVMLHLKGLALSKTVDTVLNSIGQFGLTARGMYGEGSSPVADFYQVSNQITLGVREEDVVKNIRQVVGRLINQEREVRRILYKNNQLEIEDRVMRAYGVLKHARKISSEEACQNLSMVAMGIGLGIVAPCSQETIYNLIMDTMPAMLATGENEPAVQRDVSRAELIRKTLD